MLAQTLQQLEADGQVLRVSYPVVPPKVEYSLTEKGCSIVPILQQMCDWGRHYLQD